MASITKNKTTGDKFMVLAIDSNGEDFSLFFDTHIEAQAIANVETQNKMQYFKEFEIIDGLNQHPSGFNFRNWLKTELKKKNN